jgi:predicted transcriptional regulator
MTITISSELEARLRDRARQEGQDPDTVAEVLLSAALDWEAQERREAIAGIQRGLEAGAAGRVRPASEVFAEMRAKLAHVSG